MLKRNTFSLELSKKRLFEVIESTESATATASVFDKRKAKSDEINLYKTQVESLQERIEIQDDENQDLTSENRGLKNRLKELKSQNVTEVVESSSKQGMKIIEPEEEIVYQSVKEMTLDEIGKPIKEYV